MGSGEARGEARVPKLVVKGNGPEGEGNGLLGFGDRGEMGLGDPVRWPNEILPGSLSESSDRGCFFASKLLTREEAVKDDLKWTSDV
jgi:hypothetical protein